MGEFLSRLNSWLKGTGKEFRKRWWIFLVLFFGHVVQELVKDRLVGGTNRLIDVHAGGVLGFIKPILLYFAGNPVATVAATGIVIVTLLVVHAYFETRKIPIPDKAPEKPGGLPYGHPTEPHQGNTEVAKLLNEPKEFLPKGITPRSLTDLCRGKTSVQAEKLMENYIGQWMRVEGVVRNTEKFRDVRDRMLMELDCPNPPSSEYHVIVLALFEPEWSEKVSMLVRGQRMQIEGKIKRAVGDGVVTLDNCELKE